MLNCHLCSLHRFRNHIVQGRGSIPAKVLIIGEAPGKTEDMIGKSFVGAAGSVLNNLLSDSRLNTIAYYIINTVLCRPTDKIGGDNRQPSLEEILACRQNVMSIVTKVNAVEIILSGDVAEKAFKNVFPHYTKIYDPTHILRRGGINSAAYQVALRILEDVYRKLK